MSDLIEKLEAAIEGSRELDYLVFSCTAPIEVFSHWKPTDPMTHFTTSLDAALALAERVLPDLFWDMSCNAIINGERQHHAEVFPECATVEQPSFWGNAPTPALALCIAILKARTSDSR